MNPRPRPTIKKSILRRVTVLYAIFFLLVVTVVARIVYLQYGPQGEPLRNLSREVNYDTTRLRAVRGDILSGDGHILATNSPRYNLYLDFSLHTMEKELDRPGSERYLRKKHYKDSIFESAVGPLADSLARMFGDRTPAQYRAFLERTRRESNRRKHVKLSPRTIDYVELLRVRRFPLFDRPLSGLIEEQETQRFRPFGDLARRTIGRSDDRGHYGIENAFDSLLRGSDGHTLSVKLYRSHRVPVTDKCNVPVRDGLDIVTTLDVELQDVAQSMLARQLTEGEATWGTVVLMEVQTGHIAAIANLHREGTVLDDVYNYALSQKLEPGSTFKLVSLMALLDRGGMDIEREFDCGEINPRTREVEAWIDGRRYTDSHYTGVIPLWKVFEQSSNIGFVRAVTETFGDDPARFVDFVRELNLDKQLQLQLPGTGEPVVKDPADRSYGGWDGLSLARMAYGYAIEVTPMHTLMLYNAVANGGRMVLPLFIKELRDSEGHTVQRFDPVTVNPQICSPATLTTVQECLQRVVEHGTAKVLRNPHYKVAGKTGTAQCWIDAENRLSPRDPYRTRDGGRDYVATLVGYFPADRPRYTCIVCIRTHHKPGARSRYYGAQLAGPVFAAIADRVYASQIEWQESVAEKAGERSKDLPAVKGGDGGRLRTLARDLPVTVPDGIRRHDWTVLRRTDSTTYSLPADFGTDTIPDVRGMGLRDALYLLESRGLRVAFTGAGAVTRQTPAHGKAIRQGTLVRLELSPAPPATNKPNRR